MSIFHKANGKPCVCPCRSLGQRYCYIRRHGSKGTYLSAHWVNGVQCDATDQNIRTSVKAACFALERLDTHSLRSGGANQLATAEYLEMWIQKMGRWKGDTFKEYTREELACFLAGMSKSMKPKFKILNDIGSAQGDLVDVTLAVIAVLRITPALSEA